MSHANSIAQSFGIGAALTSSAEERALVARLDTGLARVEQQLKDSLQFGDVQVDLMARYLFDAGGKRIRPLLALLTAEFGDPVNDKVFRAAQVLELVHLATLYHDDVMDDADLRRGVPTTHSVWGNSLAILVGDLLLARASTLSASLGSDVVMLHAEVFERLCLGQLHETTGPSDGADPVEHYIQVLADKTGSLIASSAVIGVMVSGAPTEYIEPLRNFGEKIGVAFQIIDDVLDLDGGETGKEKGTDVRHGVDTLPVMLLRSATDETSISLRERLDAAITAGDETALDGLITELRKSPQTTETIRIATEWGNDAIAGLSILPDGLPKQALIRFAHQVIERTK